MLKMNGATTVTCNDEVAAGHVIERVRILETGRYIPT